MSGTPDPPEPTSKLKQQARSRKRVQWRTLDVPIEICGQTCESAVRLAYQGPAASIASTPKEPVGSSRFEEYDGDQEVVLRSGWKDMGKVRRMLIPGSLSSFASCMWPSLEILAGTPIPAFARVVEGVIPFWDELPPEDQEAWAERAKVLKKKAHWIYIRHKERNEKVKKKPMAVYRQMDSQQNLDEDDVSDTDELPNRPTRKLNVVGDDLLLSREFKSILKSATDTGLDELCSSTAPRSERTGRTLKRVSFSLDVLSKCDKGPSIWRRTPSPVPVNIHDPYPVDRTALWWRSSPMPSDSQYHMGGFTMLSLPNMRG